MYSILAASSGFAFFYGLRMGGLGIFSGSLYRYEFVSWGDLERRFVAEAAGGVAAAGCGGGTPRVVSGSTTGSAAGRAEAAAGRAALGLVDLRRRVAQRRADLVDVELDHGALLALAGLVRALLEPSGRDHAHAPRQRLGDVLSRLAPDRAAQEQRLAVLPLVAVAVERARRRGDRE